MFNSVIQMFCNAKGISITDFEEYFFVSDNRFGIRTSAGLTEDICFSLHSVSNDLEIRYIFKLILH